MPDAIIEDGERLPATYANFVILNGAVLVPTYGQPGKDAEAMRIIGGAFPDREIIGIDSRAVIVQRYKDKNLGGCVSAESVRGNHFRTKAKRHAEL